MAFPSLRFQQLTQPQGHDDLQGVLGALSFSATPVPLAAPVLRTPMPGSDASIEVWYGRGSITEGEQDGIRYRHDGNWLFGVVELVETPLTPGIPPLQTAAGAGYRKIFELMDALQYPCSLRYWNYIADINKVTFGLERYRQFNLGRQEAFLASGREIKGDLPAACALGMREGPLSIAFLAGRQPGLAIENPRQMSAFDYPQEYGPRSPTFSRACLLPDEGLLLISGTASILGHQTMHAGDVIAQTRETLANLEAVVEEANKRTPGFDPKFMTCRIYVRNGADIPLVAAEVQRAWGTDIRAQFVQADICRSDLLLEIEATAVNGTRG